MNAIVSLVHFCDADGPSVIFCTQAFHDNAAEDVDECFSASNGRSSPVPTRNVAEKENGTLSNKKDLSNANRSGPASCASCAFSLPPPDTLSDTKVVNYSEKKGFKTEDDENPLITYVGSRYPQHPQLYSAVRQACVRSLSCEFCQGREGPVLFGDEKNGYVLSYMFKIKDSQARGFQRWYSFIFLMTDRIYLVASWPFLVSKFQSLASDLQSKANQIFEKENAARESRYGDTFSRSGPLSPSSPDQFLRRRANQPLRSLAELLKAKDLFVHIHANFSWILKACGRRLQERHANDQTLFQNTSFPSIFPVENSVNKKIIFNSTEELDTRIENLKSLQNLLGVVNFRKLILNFIRGNQLIIRGSDSKIIKSIVSIIKDLVPNGCSVIENGIDYQPLTKCNILCISPTTQIPNEVDKSTFCLLDFSSEISSKDEQDINKTIKFNLENGIDELTIGIVNVNGTYLPSNLYINQLSEILCLNLSPELMNMRLGMFKEEWLSKVKQYHRFIITGANIDSSVEKPVNGRIINNSLKQKELIKYLDVSEIDLPTLKFLSDCLNNV
ncbi:vesicle coat protein [Gigaspora rosea]|uniref:Folliculin n=1 Tax=Gigaspora rosea TaxID=44941 RepID=A0A397UZP9_9GLOM|nr:vesicle coat protein [Gigaspora rosea]